MYFFKNFTKKILLLLSIYFISRVCFLINNFPLFSQEDSSLFFVFLESLRYDLSILLYINSIVLLFIFFPTNLRIRKWYHKSINYLFWIVNIPFIILNNVDIEFLKFQSEKE